MAHTEESDNAASSSSEDEAPQVLQMISDGKRMRVVWKPGDGDGDSSTKTVQRSLYLVRGHPTWKLFMGDIPETLKPGTRDEPPHYTYLDDKACHDIYYSDAYSHDEMREYWPWDYNHQGHIKQGRPNRGRPAYLDDSNTVLATAPLRAKGQKYTFSGAPDETEYRPIRPRMRKPATTIGSNSGNHAHVSPSSGSPESTTTNRMVESLNSIRREQIGDKASPPRNPGNNPKLNPARRLPATIPFQHRQSTLVTVSDMPWERVVANRTATSASHLEALTATRTGFDSLKRKAGSSGTPSTTRIKKQRMNGPGESTDSKKF